MCDPYTQAMIVTRRLRLIRFARWPWTLLRVALFLTAISTTVYVSIPDYPSGIPVWEWLTTDPNGYLHEVFYIWTFFLVGIDLSYRFEEKSVKRFQRHGRV